MSENRILSAAPHPASSSEFGVSPASRSVESLPVVRTSANRWRRSFLVAWYALNFVLVVATLAAASCVVWEYSTRRYLKGFSDAIIPFTATPEEKIEAILNWMANGPNRYTSGPALATTDRNPTDTLNYNSLLQVCGTATNAFINLADSGGLAARRLLLLDSRRTTKHVVAEVLINGRWIVVDPAFRALLRGANGQLLSSEELADPAVFAAATRKIPHYDADYTFDLTSHVRMTRLRYLGLPLRKALDRLLPGWEDSTTMSLLLERESLAAMVFALMVVFILLLLRVGLRWYGERRMGLRAFRIREQLRRAVLAFLDTAS